MNEFKSQALILFFIGLLVVVGIFSYHTASEAQFPWAVAQETAPPPSMTVPLARTPVTPPPTWTVTPPGQTLPPPTPPPSTATATPTQPPPTATATPTQPPPTATWTPTPITLPPLHPTAVSLLITPTPNPSQTLPIPTPVPLRAMPDDAVTILLLGSDQRPDWDDWHTDAIQYVVIYPDVPSVSILSIPRDLYLYIPGFWMSRINFADMYGEIYNYDGGGFGLFNQTLLYNLGISADYYAEVGFDGLIGIVDTMGGIDVPVHCRLEDYWPYPDEEGEYPWFVLEPGMHHLDGKTALWYSRSRKTSSVFSRERRQQQVVEALWHRAKEVNLLATLPGFYEQTQQWVDTDLGLGNILSLGVTAAQLDATDVRQYNIGWGQVEPYVTYRGGNVYLPVWEEIEPIIDAVLARPAASRATQNAIRVEIWNGTEHADWDLLAADQLTHSGYTPVNGTPDQSSYPQTQIILFSDVTKGIGLPWLQYLFHVSQENVIYQEDAGAEVKVRIILGQDYNPCR